MRYSSGLIPIDTLILKHMPVEGTQLAEFIPLGPNAKSLARRIDGITSNQLSGRLRVLEREGFCVPVIIMPLSAGRGWQHTAKAATFLQDVEERGVTLALAAVNIKINDERNGRPHSVRVEGAQTEMETEEAS